MFGSSILEVAIGMILIYLVLSLIMTSVQEAIHAFGKTRARNLQQALLELMQGDEQVRNQFYNHPLIFALHQGTPAAGTIAKKHLPSYIPRETFSAAFMDVMEREEAIEAALPPGLREAYEGLKRAAATRTEGVRAEIERWYDAAMDRASGRFKRHSQFTLFILSLALATLLNINSLTIAQYLAVSPQQRELLTALAQQASDAQNGQGATTSEGQPDVRQNLLSQEQINRLTGEINEIGLPIGWRDGSIGWIERGFPGREIVSPFHSLEAFMAWLLLVLGYLMTAFAMMLGAPFWFDVLNKFMVIRGTVKPREKSPDESSEDRQPRQPRTVVVEQPAGGNGN